jgi:hypothetical protein
MPLGCHDDHGDGNSNKGKKDIRGDKKSKLDWVPENKED